jgi:hypothetical protein
MPSRTGEISMRNLQKYPITKIEIVECLNDFYSEIRPDKTMLVGDMRPLLISMAIEIIENAEIDERVDRENR